MRLRLGISLTATIAKSDMVVKIFSGSLFDNKNRIMVNIIRVITTASINSRGLRVTTSPLLICHEQCSQ